MKNPVVINLRWSAGLLMLDKSIVGCVSTFASGEHGAYGSQPNGDETPLGRFPTERDAKRRVEDWVRSKLVPA